MTNRTDTLIRSDVLSRALWSLSDLASVSRVSLVDVFTEHSIAPTVLVRVDVTGYPDDRDDLLAALPNARPEDWSGTHGHYREWLGTLLTMNIAVQETLPGPSAPSEPVPPASDPAGDAPIRVGEHAYAIVPTPSPVPACHGAPTGFEADCGEPGPHGPHPLGDEPSPYRGATDVEHDDDGCTTCRGDEPGPVESVVLRTASPADEQYAEAAGLVPADAENWADPKTAGAWRTYAIGRARVAFLGQSFTNPTAARAALDGWRGRVMLTDGDVAMLAGELVAPPEPRQVGRSRPFLGWITRSRPGRAGRHEHVAATGPIA